MSQSVEELFQEGIRRYQSGERVQDLLPVFEQVCQEAPKTAAAWTCLSWLYLLEANPQKALKAAQAAVKLDPVDAQPRINLTLAMLELGKTGVRQEVERIQQILVADSEQINLVKDNFVDGHQRRSEWKFLSRIEKFLFE